MPGAAMLTLLGGPALPEAQRDKLRVRLQEDNPGVDDLEAQIVHFVSLSGPLDDDGHRVLERLLTYGPSGQVKALEGRTLVVVPRIGTTSPWSSKATDI